ncbi:MAG: Txe/YoeB family addiction module toxin [Clostridia bacterium]|nr:Txe/YoeB family addiction module toxin [Clostridia bacterium]
MSEWRVQLNKQVVKDSEKIRRAGLEPNVKELIQLLRDNPYRVPPPYEKLSGDLQGKYSRRINRQHRMVYTIDSENKIVRVLSVWTHYDNV